MVCRVVLRALSRMVFEMTNDERQTVAGLIEGIADGLTADDSRESRKLERELRKLVRSLERKQITIVFPRFVTTTCDYVANLTLQGDFMFLLKIIAWVIAFSLCARFAFAHHVESMQATASIIQAWPVFAVAIASAIAIVKDWWCE
jgi:hypothetical protein